MTSLGQRLRVGFLAHANPRDARSWSGTYRSMVTALESSDIHLHILPWTADPPSAVGRVARRLTPPGKEGHDWSVSADHARAVHRALREHPVDVVLAVAASTQSARLRLGAIPMVSSSDATFQALIGQYPRFEGLSPAAVRQGERIECAAVRSATALIYPSRWAADRAVQDCGADAGRISVVPFGPNLTVPVEHVPRSRPRSPATILFVAAQWQRKGGDVAVAAVRRLIQRGADARLVCVGAPPPAELAQHVDEHMRFDKSDPEQARALAEVYRRADVLVLPSRADCSPVVLCEAAAFGVPAVASAVGGIAELVRDGVTGRVLPVEASVDEWADALSFVLHASRYESLSNASRRMHEQELNWPTWAEGVRSVLLDVTSRVRETRSA